MKDSTLKNQINSNVFSVKNIVLFFFLLAILPNSRRF